jgi:hypothetical protein
MAWLNRDIGEGYSISVMFEMYAPKRINMDQFEKVMVKAFPGIEIVWGDWEVEKNKRRR